MSGDLILSSEWRFMDALQAMSQEAGYDEAMEIQQWMERWEDGKERLFTGPPWCLTLLRGQEPVATFGGYVAPDRVVALLLWVRADHRLQGVGSRLIREFVTWSTAQYPQRRIWAADCNPAAQKVFGKLGFHPVPGDIPDPRYVNMEWRPQSIHLT